MSEIKPIKIYFHLGGPNPAKVAIILEELGVPYETEVMDFKDLKSEPFISLNPNGRLPAIEDPNTGLVTWESGAIIEYILDQYDKEAKLQYTTFPEKYQQSAWKHFQMSGQGPYFGQAAWFMFFHPEKNLTSAIERYQSEIKRVLGVINTHLHKTGKPYLVGDKCTFADLMFLPWNAGIPRLMPEGFMEEFEKEMPEAFKWNKALEERKSVKDTYAMIEKKKAEAQG